MSTKAQNILILEDIRSTHNVGAIFRTADAVGISKVYLVGYTPAPLDRFGRERGDVAKSALGAEKSIPWEQVSSMEPLLTSLKNDGYTIVALEQNEKSVDYKTIVPEGKTAVVVGNEIDGVSKEALELADVIVEIPMQGEKESLNVSVATGVLLFRLFDRE
jgi:tRNA G18 (ribose-2'-O)-methylase SpoU